MVKYVVHVSPDVTPEGEVVTPFPEEVLLDKMDKADWTDDPGTGKAVLTPGGAEIVSPIPVAPPIGYVSEPSMMDRLSQMLNARLLQLAEGDVLDESEDEANDFDVPDPEDFHPRSVYEIQLIEEAPALPRRESVVVDEKGSEVSAGGSIANGDVSRPV